MTTTQQDVAISCPDNISISGTIYHSSLPLKGAVMIAPATGIKQVFYAKFAMFLAQQGFGVITYDNRGIGKSLTGDIKKSSASLQCWGQQDQTAVLDRLMSEFPSTSYHLVGHSAGGQLVGLMPNSHNLTSIFNFACSSGCLKNMHFPYAFKAQFFMNLFIPASNLIFGHAKSQWVGMGEPLPKQVAKQWQHWCNGQGYVKTAFGKTIFEHHYDELDVPSLWLNAEDDDIANNTNVADMISVFTKAKHRAQTQVLSPEYYNVEDIGHMKFFSSQRKQLWPIAINWLTKHS